MRHRNDIQGLRAVAVLLVVLSHAGVRGLKGGFVGVDVFFVLSGFLITGLLLADSENRHPLVEFYVRRAKRILPAAALTLVVTDVVAYKLLNFVRADQIAHDSIPAALFTANIHFAQQGTDYFAQAQAQTPSALQHFWTLAVEEQFYIVWPAVLFLALFGISLRRRHREVTDTGVRRLLIVILAITVASLAWSIYSTHSRPTAAYFSTLTRAWELGLGAALAIASAHVARLPASVRASMGWLGLIAIGAAGVMYSASTPFPGYQALLPTVGAALVIAAGLSGQTRLSVGRLLSVAPMRYVGDRSYTLYLWHWPVLIIAAQYEGHDLAVRTKLLLVAGAFALSIVTYALFENPIRRVEWEPRASALGLWPTSAVTVALCAGLIISAIDTKEKALAASAAPQYPGYTPVASAATLRREQKRVVAAARSGHALPAVVASVKAAQHGAKIPAGLAPPVGNLIRDHYFVPPECYLGANQTRGGVCHLGSGSRSILVMGDSHAQMWVPSVLSMAQQDGWSVLLLLKDGCWRPSSDECAAWYRWASAEARRLKPDAVLLGAHYDFDMKPELQDATLQGMSSAIAAVRRYSRPVVIGDPPGQVEQPVDCLLSRHASMRRCTFQPGPDRLSFAETVASEVRASKAGFVDTTGWFCARGECPLVIGHTIAYSDNGHVSKTYALQLVGPFREAFRRAVRSAS